MAFSRAALPPLSSLGLFPDGKASFRSPVAPLAVQSPSWSASSVSDGGESIDSSVASSSSSSSSSSFGSPPGAAQQQHRSPTATPRPRLVAEPSQPMPMQQRTFGHLPLGPVPRPVEASRPQPSFSRTHTKRKSWSSHGSDPLSSSVEPPRRGSGLRAAFFQDVDSQPARVSPPEGSSERPSFSFPPRDRAWSASSDEAAEMEGLRANTSPVFDVGRQRDSDALRWATDAAQRRPSSNAPAQHRHRHSSYDIRSLLHFDEVAPPPATAASDLASFGAGDRRPSLDRRAVSDSVLDAVSQHPLLPLGPPPMRSISPNGNSGWPLSPPFFDRPHPYRRTQPTAATPSSVSRTITVSTTHNELGCDSRRAFSRTSKACDSCRSRKTRCSSLEGSRSCVRCDELGQPCVWSEPSKKRGSAASSARLRPSRSMTGSQTPTSPPSPSLTPGPSPVLTISGWTSVVTHDSPMTPLTSLAFDFQALSTEAEAEEPLICSGWSQPTSMGQQTLPHRRPKSEMFPSSFSAPHAGGAPSWTPPVLSSGHSPRPASFVSQSRPSVSSYRSSPDDDDRQLVFLGDNTLTLPPLRVAIGRRPSF